MKMKFAQLRAETLKLNRHIDLRVALTLFAMALGIMHCNPALGADGKEYPGTMCQPYIPSVGQKIAYTDMAINTGTNTAIVFCPLVRDAERRTGRITYAAVTVDKPTPGSGVTCSLFSRPYFGGAGWSTSASDDSTATGLRLITLPVQADTFVSGSFSIFCQIPPEGSIYHYGIVEAE
ncbi:MAG: hypothetical protein ACHBNF_11650 [Chromatiales bacterium]